VLCSLWVSLCVVQLVGLPVCCVACGSPCVLCSLWVCLCVVQLVGLPVCWAACGSPLCCAACGSSCVLCSLWVCLCVVQLVGLPVCSSSSTDVRPVLNRACHWNTCVRLTIWSPKACWNIERVSVALYKIWCTITVPFSDPQLTYTTPNKRVWKLSTSTQLRAIWHTDSLDMILLPFIGASRYHTCCVDGGTSPEYFG
jgi:hypothetical protein